MKRFFKQPDIGLLLLRVGLGLIMVSFGAPKLMAGAESWHGLGKVMGLFGITFFPQFWGFMAALSEALGGVLVAIGFKTRIAAFFLSCTLFVAFYMHYTKGDSFKNYHSAVELCIAFIALMFLGAGKYSIDKE